MPLTGNSAAAVWRPSTSKLQHPHILPLYDSGEAGGFLYYVMPYVKGESLRDRLSKEGELPIDDAVRILKEIVDALAKAHSEGVVHRDIKPDNVMLSDRHALVTDFGVAKAVSEATGRRPGWCRSLQPRYAAG
jgi:eukaryotic-like serine/threonine-protein kinase